MFTVEMLPAGRGDALWITYGTAREPRHVLVDGGIAGTIATIRERIEALPRGARRLDLLVVTHIDLDHIAGVLALLRRPPEGLVIDDIWFNGWRHLPQDPGVLGGAPDEDVDEGILGAKQAEGFLYHIEQQGRPLNAAFDGAAVMVPADGRSLPTRTLSGGMTLTLLSPTRARLAGLRRAWKRELEKEGLTPGSAGPALEARRGRRRRDDEGVLGAKRLDVEALAAEPFEGDDSLANGSSIAFVAEYEGRRLLATGDAFAEDLEAALGRLGATAEKPSRMDALKLSHHGGRHNTSGALLDLLRCPTYLVSTDGSVYEHPEQESVARVIVHGRKAGPPTLCFNYRSEENQVWDDPARYGSRGLGYKPRYPLGGEEGLPAELG